MENLRNILVMVQATPDCVGVFDYAARLAERVGAKLFVLDTIYNPFAYTGWNLPMPSLEREYEMLLSRVRDRLRVLMETEKKRIDVESMVRQGEPVSVVAKVVEEKKVDLLLAPAHQETRIEHLLFGKIMEKIVRQMPCSVLLVRQDPEILCTP